MSERTMSIIAYIADDTPADLDILQYILNREFPNWQIESFRTAEDLLERTRVQEPDIVITDLYFGNVLMSGDRLSRELKKMFPNIRIIVWTAAEVYREDLPDADAVISKGGLHLTDDLKKVIFQLLGGDQNK